MIDMTNRPHLGEQDAASLSGPDETRDAPDGSRPDRAAPMTAIRRHCVDCCMGNPQEVARCISTGCTMYLLRHGRKPTAEELATATCSELRQLSAGSSYKAIKAYCIGCAGSIHAARSCKTTSCPLHVYRGGRTGRTSTRILTDEQRAMLAERMARVNALNAMRRSSNG